ncbi:GGDEF domain-containing protein [Oricola nitratireducens]|uniref:GGDEF domain-containing protein n=1 Tax=Oricola nitratireducens TaxID=2775868 RepID=UPI001865B5AE|nr:GGDEF domain-containing protein [Oricola nitratireducens]
MLDTENLHSGKPDRGGHDDPVALASRALHFAETYNTPPVPKIYEIWYAFAAGKPEKLCQEIRKLIAANGAVSSYELDQLHREFLALSEEQRREQELAGFHLDREMHKAIGLVQRHIGSNDRFAETLKKSANAMTATANPAKLQQTVEFLLVDNGRMRAESVKLSHSLDQIRIEVRKLGAQLEKARQNEFKDPLTNVANRRYFDRALPRFIADAFATGSPLNLVMADLDHFKLVNDTFGHQVGDDVLRYFAALLQKNVKGRDIVARYGGEEFAIILPSTTSANAKLLMQQIMAQLGRANLVVSKGHNPIGKVTSTFGIAQATRSDDAETLIKRADMKLLEAKQTGRNRIASDAD